MSETKEKVRKYQLIKFISTNKNRTSLLPIDRVPRHWVRYDIDKGQTVVKFPSPPYTQEKQTLIDHLVKTESPPLSSWPEYAIELVGHADTYDDSEKRLTILEKYPFAFTSDSDTAPQEKVSQIVKHLEKQSLEQIMEVRGMEDEASIASDDSISQRDSSSSENSSAASSHKKITKRQGKGRKCVQKKTISISQSNGRRSSKSQKSNELRSQTMTPSEKQKKHQNPLQKHSKSISKTALSDPLKHIAQTEVVTDVNISNGAYVVQESGELELIEPLNERSSSSEKDSSPIDNTENLTSNKKEEVEFHHLNKLTNFDKCLSTASDVLTKKAKKNCSNDTSIILSALKGLSVDLQQNTRAINNVLAAIQHSQISTHTNSDLTAPIFETGFELPFKTLEEFSKFEEQLQDAKYRQHCAASLLFYIDRENHVSKSITNILKKFVGRNVCMLFTAVKQMSKKKEVFKNTTFSNVMFEVVTRHHTDNQGQKISEKYFFHCLGQALANSKDWDGHRMERVKKDKAKD